MFNVLFVFLFMPWKDGILAVIPFSQKTYERYVFKFSNDKKSYKSTVFIEKSGKKFTQ